jgi:hypothetical protein
MGRSAQISVYRSPDIWMDRNRVYKVMIDGKVVGELWPSQIESFRVAEGAHRVRVKIDLMGSNELEVEATFENAVELACRGGGSVVAMLKTIFKRNSYLNLRPITTKEKGDLARFEKGKEPPAPRNLGSDLP